VRRALRLAAVAVTASLVAGCGPGLQSFSIGRGVSGPSYRLTAVFTDATGLPVGGRVELHDVTIGRVQSLSTSGFRAYVHMVISKSAQLPVGTTATLALTTPLGEEYVNLVPPKTVDAGYLASGATISADDTYRSPDVENLLAASPRC
jgi:phospholipid/cholesterol/gamma-HCH transport system substrate-binding protein